MEDRKKRPESNDAVSKEDRDLLRTILTKDNDRIKQEIRNAETDVVFELGFEGGGLEVTRYRAVNGKVYFRTSGTSMTLDEKDDEKWIDWEDEPVASFEGSLAELRLGTNILCITPISVHPDFRLTVRTYIEELLAKVTTDDRQRMGEFLAASADEWFDRLDRFGSRQISE
ncbi:MAG: hypothetical protein IPO41_07255 [Acidobacteria bacterium]|nr:hypothetical protein [Acidobacteriota bacterium]